MPVDPDKRKLRELKRAVKKRGNKHRRQQLKRDLTENPEEAAHSEEQLGRFQSAEWNGLDRESDSTRRKKEDKDSPQRHEGDTKGHGED